MRESRGDNDNFENELRLTGSCAEEMANELPVQLIDQRGIAKVPAFSGRRDHFEEWAFCWAGRNTSTPRRPS